MSVAVQFAPMQPQDWDAVARIYDEGIQTGLATLEPSIPTWETWNEAHLPQCRLVATMDGEVVAWAALLPVSKRKSTQVSRRKASMWVLRRVDAAWARRC